ncbi:MAG: type I methionyl aminopeptidase [Clostridia bacterium]|nr:type I methionyl aminopeptidase [Clostridia bacterium]
MITIKSQSELSLMRQAGSIVRDALLLVEESIRPGITTRKIDSIVYEYITKCGAKPSFLGYEGYPASACVSVNDEVVHGIPSDRVIVEGDIVSVDVGAQVGGYHGDAARTFGVGAITGQLSNLIQVCKQSFFEGVKYCIEGMRLGDISSAIQTYVESNGYSIVRELTGHGIGKQLHEDPYIPNYGIKGKGVRLQNGMALAIEPMINMGAKDVWCLEDGWTVTTRDGLPSAHYENTVVITQNGPEILTL